MRGTILVVENEAELSHRLAAEGFLIRSATTSSEAIDMVESSPPDLVVLDSIVSEDGYEICERIRELQSAAGLPIVSLGDRESEEDEIRALERGANIFMDKRVSDRLLVSRIRALLRHAKPAARQPAVLHRHDLIIDRGRYLVRRPGKDREQRIHLPRKEFELLSRLAVEPGRVLSREDLLDAIWGRDVYVTPRTVDVHVRKIRDKIGDSYIETVKGVGYRFREV